MRPLLMIALLAAPRCAAALRRSPEPLAAAGAVPLAADEGKRQVLYNYKDVQYYSHITIGGQVITALLDTGSFELVVFDSSCIECGTAGKYAKQKSKSFREGKLTDHLNYMSGSVDVVQAFDMVAIGPYPAVELNFWDGVQAAMPVLRKAAYNSIIGVGPPETPGAGAWDIVQDDVNSVRQDLDEGGTFPSESTEEGILQDTARATGQALQRMITRANNVTRFSVCLGRVPRSNGYFVWNDMSHLDAPSLFSFVKVLGKHSWTVNMTNMGVALGGGETSLLGCSGGCGAIIDSGTSLLLMPYRAIYALRDQLKSMNAKCDDLRTLPRLTFKLDGKEFSLPPDAFISRLTSPVVSAAARGSKNYLAEIVRLDFGGGECQLNVMGSGTLTRWGPLLILGMPFFRKYYTTFNFGRDHDERGLFVTPASRNCTPAKPVTNLGRDAGFEQMELRELSSEDDIFIPKIVHRAFTEPFLKDL